MFELTDDEIRSLQQAIETKQLTADILEMIGDRFDSIKIRAEQLARYDMEFKYARYADCVKFTSYGLEVIDHGNQYGDSSGEATIPYSWIFDDQAIEKAKEARRIQDEKIAADKLAREKKWHEMAAKAEHEQFLKLKAKFEPSA